MYSPEVLPVLGPGWQSAHQQQHDLMCSSMPLLSGLPCLLVLMLASIRHPTYGVITGSMQSWGTLQPSPFFIHQP